MMRRVGGPVHAADIGTLLENCGKFVRTRLRLEAKWTLVRFDNSAYARIACTVGS
jgi:hypothetical protein